MGFVFSTKILHVFRSLLCQVAVAGIVVTEINFKNYCFYLGWVEKCNRLLYIDRMSSYLAKFSSFQELEYYCQFSTWTLGSSVNDDQFLLSPSSSL